MYKILAFIFTPFLFIAGCGLQNNESTQDLAKSLIFQLEGQWTDESGYVEQWIIDDDKNLVGEAAFLNDGELRITEKLKIVKSDTGFIYQATVFDQNEGQTIGFPLIVVNESMLVFENLSHDFPNRISYSFMNKKTLNVRVESVSDTSKYFELNLVRAK